MTKMWVPSNRS